MNTDNILQYMKNRKFMRKLQLYTPSIHTFDYKLDKKPIVNPNDDLRDKIRSINKQVFNNYINYDIEHKPCDSCNIINGMYIFLPVYNDTYLQMIYDKLEKTFDENKLDPNFTYQDGKNRIFMFDNMNLIKIINYSFKLNPDLSNIIKRYIADIINMLKIPEKLMKVFLEKSKLVIVRYKNNAGIHLHIDNVRRGNGPVITMSIGPNKNIYSMVPLESHEKAIQIYFPNGSIVIMDDESRYLWAHGIPYGYDYGNTDHRYSFVLLTHKYKEENNKCFNSEIYGQRLCGFFNDNDFQSRVK